MERANRAKQAGGKLEEDVVHNDFKREMLFYRQAQAAVLEGLPRLQSLGVKTKRPDDYFAQMAKSDQHMNKIRAKLLSKGAGEGREDQEASGAEKIRKKVQLRVFQKRHSEKKMKRPPQHVTGGYQGSSYPEGNADRTSLGGWQSDLKFGKIVGGVVTIATIATL